MSETLETRFCRNSGRRMTDREVAEMLSRSHVTAIYDQKTKDLGNACASENMASADRAIDAVRSSITRFGHYARQARGLTGRTRSEAAGIIAKLRQAADDLEAILTEDAPIHSVAAE